MRNRLIRTGTLSSPVETPREITRQKQIRSTALPGRPQGKRPECGSRHHETAGQSARDIPAATHAKMSKMPATVVTATLQNRLFRSDSFRIPKTFPKQAENLSTAYRNFLSIKLLCRKLRNIPGVRTDTFSIIKSFGAVVNK